MKTKLIILIIMCIFNLSLSYALSCDSFITQNTILNESLECSKHGLVISSNHITLDCNNNTMTGKRNGVGIYIRAANGITIKNCNINNFSIGIHTQTIYSGNSYSKSNNPKIFNNTLKNNIYGYLSDYYTIYEEIHSNKFINNSKKGIHLNSFYGEIYNNIFTKSGIGYLTTGDRTYCKDNLKNIYKDGAKGPNCDCIIYDEDMIVNRKERLCHGVYNITKTINFMDTGELDCQKSLLIGKVPVGFMISGSKQIKISNCHMKNFTSAIQLIRGSEINPLRGNYKESIRSPREIEIKNNLFQENSYGIYNKDSTYDKYFNNKFKNNSNSIHIRNSNFQEIYGNIFYDTSIDTLSSKGKYYCKDNLPNSYLGKKGPSCNCIIPNQNMIIDSSVKFCSGDYNFTNTIIVLKNGNINCNGARLIGDGGGVGILLSGTYKSKIENCEILNYTFAIDVGFLYEGGAIKLKSEENEIINNTIYNVDYAIRELGFNNVLFNNAPRVNNNYFNARIINIYNPGNRFINATNNYWGENNLSLIENKLTRKENVLLIPYYNISNRNFTKKLIENKTRKDFIINIKGGNYRLRKIFSKNNSISEFPVVLGSGLWSNISSWDKFSKELSKKGHTSYLIELTGGEGTECDNCTDYNYSFLIKEVFPEYINFILNESDKEEIIYIGHSNGARVALDSIENSHTNYTKFKKIFLIGIPGNFERLSFFGKIINNNGEKAINSIENQSIKHMNMSTIAKELNTPINKLFGFILDNLGGEKISLNLFKKYYEWISKEENKNSEVKIKNLTLIYGDVFNRGNDLIVPVIDEHKIFDDIDSIDKRIIETRIPHIKMTNSNRIKRLIFEEIG